MVEKHSSVLEKKVHSQIFAFQRCEGKQVGIKIILFQDCY